MSHEHRGWIGVDLDGCLAKYENWDDGKIGDPVPLMLMRVKLWLKHGRDVRIFTARASTGDKNEIKRIQDWTEKHLGKRLPVTNVKDFKMEEIWDDRAFRIEKNTGRRIR